MGSATALHSLATAAVPGSLDAVHALLEQVWRETDWSATQQAAFTTAVAEVAANIVEHAAAGGPVPLRVVVRALPDRLEALFEDGGTPYDGSGTHDGGDPLAESGRGLALARALVDEVAYERDGTLNRWLVGLARRPA